ncbi:MAG: hypothetical protein ABR520_00880, partial [Mycobacteriales bacterium]
MRGEAWRRAPLLLAVVLVAVGIPGSRPTAAHALAPTAGQSTYVPLDPVRILDTRNGTGVPAGAVGAGGAIDVVVAGTAGVPVTATAVVLNVTATAPTAATDVRVYPVPDDSAFVPTVSNLNVVAGRTVANLVTSKLGRNGAVRLRNAAGDVHLIADVSGYYAEGAAGSSYETTQPARLLDTRTDAAGAFGPGEVRTLLVRGGAPLSPSTSSAVALNVTAIAATEQTDVRVYPTRAGSGPPQVSNLNPPAGRTTPAAVIVAVGDDGTVSLRNAAGAVHLAVDLLGWYTPGTDAAVFHPVAPRRVLDTRSGAGSLGPGETRDLFVAGATVVPFAAQAVVVNVTAVGATAASDVRVYPRPAAPSDPPNASNLNVVAGQTAS